MENTKLYTFLALAGAVPFLACALLPLLGYDAPGPLGPLSELASSYGLAIVCFMAGAHWGIYLTGRSPGTFNLFLVSNAIFLAAWFAYIGARVDVAVGVQILALLTLLLIDWRLKIAGVVTRAYLRVRVLATLIAVGSLLIVIFV